MKTVAYVLPELSRKGAGIFEAAKNMATSLHASSEFRVVPIGPFSDSSREDLETWSADKIYGYRKGLLRVGSPRGLLRALDEIRPDIVHCHTTWLPQNFWLCMWLNSNRVPYVISPHGALEAWALKKSKFKKNIASVLYENSFRNCASCMQALTENEMAEIRRVGYTGPIAVIPNSIRLSPEFSSTDLSIHYFSRFVKSRRFLLFLGRLDPKKNVESLIRAISLIASQMRATGWCLVVAGPADSAAYAEKIQTIIERSGVADLVLLSGPVYGLEKQKVFSACDGFVLPSLSEGLPMAVLEALSYKKPVLISANCNLSWIFGAKAGFECGIEPYTIADAVLRLIKMKSEELVEMGLNGYCILSESYLDRNIAHKLELLYRWLTNTSAAPSFLHFVQNDKKKC